MFESSLDKAEDGLENTKGLCIWIDKWINRISEKIALS